MHDRFLQKQFVFLIAVGVRRASGKPRLAADKGPQTSRPSASESRQQVPTEKQQQVKWNSSNREITCSRSNR